eukprot:m.112598 g.112598  ORF g.112598 m.112598 type:complete len:67 (+) comp37442_c0_seq4:851-1051(+)
MGPTLILTEVCFLLSTTVIHGLTRSMVRLKDFYTMQEDFSLKRLLICRKDFATAWGLFQFLSARIE